jgi:hypothetical protein
VLNHRKAPHAKVFLAVALNTAARAGAILDLMWNGANLIDFGAINGGKRRVFIPIGGKLLPVLAAARGAATGSNVVEYRCTQVASVKTGPRSAPACRT